MNPVGASLLAMNPATNHKPQTIACRQAPTRTKICRSQPAGDELRINAVGASLLAINPVANHKPSLAGKLLQKLITDSHC
jgi:hypothetical protein